MKTIKQTYIINAPIEKVWQALVDPSVITKWGGGPAKMDDQVGTNFSLWGGDIHGQNLQVSQNKKLVQNWYGGNWQEPSKVTFTLKRDDNMTEIDLLHQKIPDKESGSINDGWKRYYLGPLKQLLEK